MCRKNSLELHGEDHFKGEISARIENSSPSRHIVYVGIFKSAEMALVSAVEQIVGNEVQLAELVAIAQQKVGAKGGVQERVGWRSGFGVCYPIVMALTEVVLNAEADVGIVEDVVGLVMIG